MTTTYEPEAPSSMNGQQPDAGQMSTPQPPRSARKRSPSLHTDATVGRFILDEALTHLEALEAQETAATGAEKRRVANRRWTWQTWVEQLEAFHTDEDI